MSHALASGTMIAGKYRVKRLLGQGGMGAVYEGEHVEIGKRVAIKVIDTQHAGHEELATRFRREARAASAVESDNIVQVFDVGHDDAAGLYMVMEFLTGEDLAQRIARSGALPVEEVLAIGTQAARALAKAHAAGVVHRDLKPANLFLVARDEGGPHLKILDFGISKLVREEASSTATQGKALTREGSVIGTPQYMSPEQAQGQAVDQRTDVWSLGALLYEALAGKPPFEEKPTYEMTIITIVTGTVRRLDEVAPHVPKAVADVIHRALVHDRDARLADCGAFAKALSDLRQRTSVSDLSAIASAPTEVSRASVPRAAPPTAAGVTLGPTTEAPSRRPPIVAIAAIAVIVLGAGAFMLLRKHEPTATVERPATVQRIVAAPSEPTAERATAPVPSAAPSTVPAELAAPSATVIALPPPTKAPVPPSSNAKPAAKPTRKPDPSTPATQYGGAGVSTSY